MTLLKGNDILTKPQCNVLRGLAIIGIFLHNFSHWLKGGHHENEYLFHQEHSNTMWAYWTNGVLDGFEPLQFFSFFGHYGVPVFLFLSGFGLVMKYEGAGAARVKTVPFLAYQWLKLFRLMLLGLIACVLVYNVWCGFDPYPWHVTLAQLGMVVNFMYQSPGGAILVGPYWFFGLMVEIYVIYRLLIYPTAFSKQTVWRWLMPVLLAVAAWASMAACEPQGAVLNFLRYNATVGMLPLAMGVLVGRYGMPRLPHWVLAVVAVVALPLVAVANLNFHAWLWAPLLVVAGAVAVVKLFDRWSATGSGVVMKPLAWMGMMSSFIFVVHSVPRMPMFKFVLWRQQQLLYTDYCWIAAYIVLTLLLAWLYKVALSYVPSPRLSSDGRITFNRKKG